MKSILKVVVVILIGVALNFVVNTYARHYSKLPECDYCHDRNWEKYTPVGRYKLCERCWDMIDEEARKIFGNEYSQARLEWIRDFITKHKEWED